MNLSPTRRAFLCAFSGAAAAGLLRPCAHGAALLPLDSLAAAFPPQAKSSSAVRKYRVHATISLLGVPVYTRKDVGSGFALLERLEAGDTGGGLLSLQFGAGSIPERARGLNRSGFFHELVAPGGRAAYFGFMTSSPENNLDEAKTALAKQNGAVLFKAISGTAVSGRAEATVWEVEAPGAIRWPQWRQLSRHIRSRLSGKGELRRLDGAGGARTFLHAVYSAIESPQTKRQAEIVYNGKRYRLSTAKSADGHLTRVDGVMEQAGEKSSFRLWTQAAPNDALPLPEKIESKVRSFLKLTFEADPALDLPAGNLLASAEMEPYRQEAGQ